MSTKKPCSRCRGPMSADSRGDLCRECWATDKRAKRLASPAIRKPQRPKRPCSMCGNKTRSADGLCSLCSGEVNRGRGRLNPDNPNTCPRCAGLPWRRGDGAGDSCPICCLLWEPEELPPLESYLWKARERMIAVGDVT